MPHLPLPDIFRTLRHRNFRLFIIGQGISLIGTWGQSTAMAWLVYRLTDSVFLLGLVGFANQIPSFFLTPVTGVIADGYNRRKILLVSQSLSMVQAFLLAGLVLSGTVAVWHLVTLSFILGIINAQDMPARQAFFLEMIENKDDLGNAIALNSSAVNVGRLLGPAIGGMIIAAVGEGMCFLLNGLSFFGVLIALARMRIAHRTKRPRATWALQAFKEGVRYAYGFAPIRWLLMLIGLSSLVGFPYTVFLPVVARDMLNGGPHTLGFLMAAAGLGALCGALFLASRKNIVGLGDWVARAAFIFGAGLVAFSFSRILILSLLLILIMGFGMIVQLASCNTLLQTLADDDKRGRVMSFYTMAFMGVTPIGSLFAGSIADWIGTPLMLLIGGCCCLAGACAFYWILPSFRQQTHTVYVKTGIEAVSKLDL